MLNFSGGELLIILILGLILFGPKQLITIASRFGQWLAKWRSFTQEFKTDLEKYQKLEENQKRAELSDQQYKNKNN